MYKNSFSGCDSMIKLILPSFKSFEEIKLLKSLKNLDLGV